MKNLDFITLILAGGRGERLSVLTKEISKPAIPFGGAYRLIDFTLSNCKHSNAGVIGILTQYRQDELADYIGSGKEWRPANGSSEIITLPSKDGFDELYRGTADAIWKNTRFIDDFSPENALVLSGDHVYKMNYAEMLETHQNTGAAVTIAAISVPWSEAPRFGIINTGKDDRIIGFEEKPLNPKTNLASMGVYIFNWKTLRNHLFISNIDSYSSNDIGRDIIPQMLMCGEKLVVHRFGGYWRDVGNIYSLWEANMELLSEPPSINLHDENWNIISRNNGVLQYHKHYSTVNGYVKNSLVSDGCKNKGKITNSVISNAEIGEGASILNSVIMPGAKIGAGASIINSIVGFNAVVDDNTVISCVKPDGNYLDNYQGISVIGNNVNISRHNGGRMDSAASLKPEYCAV